MKETNEKSATELEIERLQLRGQLDLLYEAKAKAEDELAQYNDLLNEISSLNDKRSALQADMEKEKTAFLTSLDELSKKKDLTQKEVADLALDVVNKQKQVKALDDDMESLRAKGLMSMGQLDDVQKQLKAADIQIAEKQLTLNDLEQVKANKNSAQAELNAKQKELDSLRTNIDKLKQEIVDAAVQKEKTESATKDLAKLAESHKQTLESLRADHEKQKSANEKLLNDFLEFKKTEEEKLSAKEKELSDRSSDMSVKEAWFAKQVSLVKKYKAEAEKHFGTRFDNLTI